MKTTKKADLPLKYVMIDEVTGINEKLIKQIIKKRLKMKTIKLSLAIMAICTLTFACKKSTVTPTPAPPTNQTPAVNPNDSIYYTISMYSNYLRSSLKIYNLTDGLLVRGFNDDVDVTTASPITYSFYCKNNKKYDVQGYSKKDSMDSTLYMANTNHLFNKLVISKGSTIVYNHTDSLNALLLFNNFYIN